MTKVTTHQIDAVNKSIEIEPTGDPSPGGAYPGYRVTMAGDSQRTPFVCHLPFISERHSGLTNEALLAIVLDRLMAFQRGPFACNENHRAIQAVDEALEWLRDRARDRQRRGVSDKQEK